MHRPSLILLLALLPLAPMLQAEESSTTNSPVEAAPAEMTEVTELTSTAQLELELATMTRQRDELLSQMNDSHEQESAQLQRLRKDNQKLSLQLREALSRQPQNLISEQQMWYLLGGVTALLGAAIGAFLRGNRRRREWIN